MTSSGLLQYLNNTRVDATAGGCKGLEFVFCFDLSGFVAFFFSILLLLDVTALRTCMCTQQIYESSRNVKIEKTSRPIQDNQNLAQYEKTAEDEGQTWQAGRAGWAGRKPWLIHNGLFATVN